MQADLTFFFPAETHVVAPVLPRSIDDVVVTFVVVLKFPNVVTNSPSQGYTQPEDHNLLTYD